MPFRRFGPRCGPYYGDFCDPYFDRPYYSGWRGFNPCWSGYMEWMAPWEYNVWTTFMPIGRVGMIGGPGGMGGGGMGGGGMAGGGSNGNEGSDLEKLVKMLMNGKEGVSKKQAKETASRMLDMNREMEKDKVDLKMKDDVKPELDTSISQRDRREIATQFLELMDGERYSHVQPELVRRLAEDVREGREDRVILDQLEGGGARASLVVDVARQLVQEMAWSAPKKAKQEKQQQQQGHGQLQIEAPPPPPTVRREEQYRQRLEQLQLEAPPPVRKEPLWEEEPRGAAYPDRCESSHHQRQAVGYSEPRRYESNQRQAHHSDSRGYDSRPQSNPPAPSPARAASKPMAEGLRSQPRDTPDQASHSEKRRLPAIEHALQSYNNYQRPPAPEQPQHDYQPAQHRNPQQQISHQYEEDAWNPSPQPQQPPPLPNSIDRVRPNPSTQDYRQPPQSTQPASKPMRALPQASSLPETNFSSNSYQIQPLYIQQPPQPPAQTALQRVPPPTRYDLNPQPQPPQSRDLLRAKQAPAPSRTRKQLEYPASSEDPPSQALARYSSPKEQARESGVASSSQALVRTSRGDGGQAKVLSAEEERELEAKRQRKAERDAVRERKALKAAGEAKDETRLVRY